MSREIEYGELSIDDMVPLANVAASSLDIADEQMRYDSLYRLLSPKTISEVSHDVDIMEAVRYETWPRFATSPALIVGSGGSQGLRKMLSFGVDAYGIDISREAAKYYHGIEDRFTVGTSHNLPYQDKRFRSLLCCDVLEHVKPELIDKTLSEFSRVCDGVFVIWVCCEQSESIRNMHRTIQPPEWWLETLSRLGRPYLTIGHRDRSNTKAKAHCGWCIEAPR